MKEFGYISDNEYEKAKNEKVEFRKFSSGTIKAPHFVFYVIDQLTKMYGKENLAQKNLKVITTLDWELQKKAEQIVYERAMENTEKFDATNASLMAIDPKTGGILVMVGSRDYFDDEIDGNFNIGLAKRQPGSSFKPFGYAAALKKGYTTETIVYDVKTQFSTACKKTNLTSENGCYSPGNYDHKFRGPMTFRNALAQSVNVPAIKALYLAGIDNTMHLAKDMGISTLDNWKRYGLTLILGGGEVSLLEMTSAYGVFANEGYRNKYTSIDKIYSENKEIYTIKNDGQRVIEADIARSITDILADNKARTPAFGSNSYLYFKDHDVAVKTGTTNDYRDAWIIGYTPEISVGAWAGNNNNSPMKKKVAGFIIAPLWNDFMNFYFEKYPNSGEFTPPPKIDDKIKPVLRGYEYKKIDDSTGSSTNINMYSDVHSILHWVDKDNPLGPIPTHPEKDPQYKYWEYGVLLWQVTQGDVSIFDVINNNQENNPNNSINVKIKSPKKFEKFNKKDIIEVKLDIQTEDEILKTEYYIDGVRVKTKENKNETFIFMPGEQNLKSGKHTLIVIVYTNKGSRGGSSVDFRIR